MLVWFVFQLRGRRPTTDALQPTAGSWTDPAYQVSIRSLSQSLPVIARAPPSQCAVYILSLLDSIIVNVGEKKKKKRGRRLKVLTISFCSKSVVFIMGCYHVQHVLLLWGFLDYQYVLNSSGFQRSQLFDFWWAGEICETSSHHVVTVFHLNIAHIEDSWAVVMFFAFWHDDQYITYLLFTHLSFQNCHLLRLRHRLAFVSVMYRFLVIDVNRSHNLIFSSIGMNWVG